jgi:hypothetical protein
VPFPLPGEPLVIVIHDAVVVAVQLHPVAAVTLMLPVPAVEGGFVDDGEMVGEHVAPDWFTVNVVPPTDTVPVLDVVAVFAASV